MKFFAFVCLVGFAAASSSFGSYSPSSNRVGWKPNTNYEFKYEGRMLSGIPELASHYSGLGLNTTVNLHVSSDYEFSVSLSNSYYVRVNDPRNEGNSQEENNWRQIQLPQFQPVPEESKRYLEEPTVFRLSKSGKFEKMIVSSEEPEWTVNFKKALIVLFQTRFEQAIPNSEEIESNILKPRSGSDDEIDSSYWITKEESVDGICDVTYEINEIPEAMIRQQPWLIPSKQECSKQGSQQKYWELVKTKDVSSCVRRTSFSSYKPGFFRCPAGNCDGQWARSSITRYYLCGSYSNLLVQRIVNEGELQQELMGFRTEKFLTGTRQVLDLVRTSSGSRMEGKQEPSSPVTLKSLLYEYNIKKTVRGEGKHVLDQSQLESNPSLYQSIPSNLLTTSSPNEKQDGLKIHEIKEQITQLFTELIGNDLRSPGVAKKQVTMKVLSIARGLSLLRKSDIEQVYQEVVNKHSGEKDQQMSKNLFFDSVMMGGSYDDIDFIKDKIRAGVLTQGQAISIFTFLPQYVLTPSRGVLQNVQQLVQSEEVQRNKTVFGHAIMGFSTLLQRACLDENRESSYPTNVYGNFCSPHSELLTVQWIPFLQQRLQNAQSIEEQNMYIVSLGLLSHKQVLPALIPYVEGYGQQEQDSNSRQSSNLTRFLAINSLSNAGHYNRDLVLPILSKIFINPVEQTEQRLAAFNVLLKLNPPTVLLQKIASSTWFEKNQEVLSAVNSAFYSLSQYVSNEQDRSWNIRASLAQKAAIVYPLLKASSHRYPTSGSILYGDNLSQLGVAYRGLSYWIADKEGNVLPQDIYSKIVYYLGRYQYAPLEIAIRNRQGQNIIKQLVKIIDPGQEQEESEFSQQVGEKIHSEWRHVLEKLQPKVGKSKSQQDTVSAYFYATIAENMHFFTSLHSDSAEMLREKIAPMLKNGEGIQNLINGEGSVFSSQRTFDLAPTQVSIPSDMGFPIILELHMPVVASAVGNAQLKPSLVNPKVSVNVQTVIATQMIGWVGTQCPFSKEYVLTGLDEHAVLTLPGQITIDASLEEQKFNMDIQMSSSSQQSQDQIDLLHYHIRPFTVAQKLNNLRPVTLSKNINFINARSISDRRQSEGQSSSREEHYDVRKYKVGDYLGMDFQAVFKTQSPYLDIPQWVQKLRTYNYNPLNLVRFFWASSSLSEQGKPSLRMHEFQLQYNPSSSHTNNIRISIQGAYGTKSNGQSVRFHNIEKSESSWTGVKVASKKINEIESSKKTESHEKVEETLGKLGVESGSGYAVKASVTLRGQGRPRTYTYNMHIASGWKSFTQKWNIKLASQSSSQNQICVNGEVHIPRESQLDIEKLRQEDISISFQNVIGFNNECQSKVIVSGKSETSEEQKRYSRQSPDAKVYKRMLEQGTPLAKLSRTAEKVRSQATTQDKINAKIQYVNFPSEYLYIPNAIREYVKAYLVSYRQMNVNGQNSEEEERRQHQQEGENVNQETQIKLRFSQWSQNFNLTLQQKNGNELKFKRVPIGAPLSYVLPVSTRRSGEIVAGESVLSGATVQSQQVCLIEGNWMETFNQLNKTTNIDRHWHVMSGNCNKQNPNGNGVLVRNLTDSRESNKEVKVLLGQTEVLFTPEQRVGQNSPVEVRVNGSRVNLNNGVYTITDRQGHFVGRITSNPQQSQINLQSSPYQLDLENQGGYLIRITERLRRSNVCGMCTGRGPQRCIYSKDSLLTASYRVSVPSKPCGPSPLKEEVERENERCVKSHSLATKVSGGYKSQTGKCTKHRHEVIYKGSKICFSQVPLVECSDRCRPEGGKVVEKKVGIVCLKKDRKSEHMAQKAAEGKTLRELRSFGADYEREERMPRNCVPSNKRV